MTPWPPQPYRVWVPRDAGEEQRRFYGVDVDGGGGSDAGVNGADVASAGGADVGVGGGGDGARTGVRYAQTPSDGGDGHGAMGGGGGSSFSSGAGYYIDYPAAVGTGSSFPPQLQTVGALSNRELLSKEPGIESNLGVNP